MLRYCQRLVLVGNPMYATGVFLYYLQFQQFGGYFVALATQRGERFNGGRSQRAELSIPGFCDSWHRLHVLRLRVQPETRAANYLLWTDRFLVPPGASTRRSPFASPGSACHSRCAHCASAELFTPESAHLGADRARLPGVSVYGYARTLVTNVAGGLQTPDEAFQELTNTWTSDWIMPGHTEFAGPYYRCFRQSRFTLNISTGLRTTTLFLPCFRGFCIRVSNPKCLQGFAEQVHRGNGSVTGWGYNPVAEAYVNFGAIGVVLIFVLWSLFFLAVGALRSCGTWGVLTSAALLSEAITANRIDFRNVYWETTYFVAGVMLATCIAATINKIWSKPRRHIDNWIQ